MLAEANLVALIRRGGINPRCERQIPTDLIIIQVDCLKPGFLAVTEVDHHYELNIQKFLSYQKIILVHDKINSIIAAHLGL